ncbi:S8 family serine peptidase [Actinomadura luteofluorescens]|uniref:S8 family serine peptidase n=1 Tax=Actinomadura luteofluorescens TaxID=46163 RepID=UPI00363B76DB
MRQVGAPQAWSAGYTGEGAKVAVLDTGVDAGHPDLQGRIAETRNFSESADAADRVGHGTHVASTVAGTGAASRGERRGVAPRADLLIGKVLDDEGSGTDSSVIAGMEWAAPRADVVNMSLGGAPTDGTDPSRWP